MHIQAPPILTMPLLCPALPSLGHALAPQCCADASLCLRRSRHRLTMPPQIQATPYETMPSLCLAKLCPRLANPYDAMPERCCAMRSNALAVQCLAAALRIKASAFLVAVDQLVEVRLVLQDIRIAEGAHDEREDQLVALVPV